MSNFALTPEQHQKILYGDYFNGVDAPLKTTLQVKIERSWANEQARRKASLVHVVNIEKSETDTQAGLPAGVDGLDFEVPVPVTRALSLTGDTNHEKSC